MEQQILDIVTNEAWMWMQDLESYFMLCDIRTHHISISREFKGAVTNLVEKGLIKTSTRLEMKGYYKKWGEIVQKTELVE